MMEGVSRTHLLRLLAALLLAAGFAWSGRVAIAGAATLEELLSGAMARAPRRDCWDRSPPKVELDGNASPSERPLPLATTKLNYLPTTPFREQCAGFFSSPF